MRRQLLLLAIIIGLVLIPATLALTGSLQNARVILRPEVPADSTVTIDRTMLVHNVNEVPIVVTLVPDSKMKKLVQLIENDVILNPGESRHIPFRIVLKSGGNYNGNIAVAFASADPSVNSAPVGLSSTIIIVADGPKNDFFYDVMNATEEDDNADDSDSSGSSSDDANDDSDSDADDDTDSDSDADNDADSDSDADADTADANDSTDEKKSDMNIIKVLLIVVGAIVVLLIVLIIVGIIKKLK